MRASMFWLVHGEPEILVLISRPSNDAFAHMVACLHLSFQNDRGSEVYHDGWLVEALCALSSFRVPYQLLKGSLKK